MPWPYADVRAVVPKLAEPWWYKHVHSGMFFVRMEREALNPPPLSPKGQKIQRRKAIKAARRAAAGVTLVVTRKKDRRRTAGLRLDGLLRSVA